MERLQSNRYHIILFIVSNTINLKRHYAFLIGEIILALISDSVVIYT